MKGRLGYVLVMVFFAAVGLRVLFLERGAERIVMLAICAVGFGATLGLWHEREG